MIINSLIIILLINLNLYAFQGKNYLGEAGEIILENKIIISSIAHLDIDDKDNLLITDIRGKQVLIFSREGKFIRKLSLEDCNPGFAWYPIKAKYSYNSERIFLVNSIPWGFRFKGNGECLSAADKLFIAPFDFCFNPSGNIVGYYTTPIGSSIKIMDQFGSSKKEFKADLNEFKNLIYRIEGGGIITDDNGFIYQMNVISPTIYKYNPEGKFIKAIDVTPSFFRKADIDISPDPVQVMQNIGKMFKSYSFVASLHLLDTNKILIQYFHGRDRFFSVVDLEGEFIIEEIQTEKLFIAAKNGKLYMVIQPEPDKNGILSNPKIEVYNLKEKIYNR